jgi:hypothetical protein
MSLRTLLSRYGGHMVMMGQPKTGNYDIHNPKESFLELFQTYNVIYDKHTRYMSSYKTYAPVFGPIDKIDRRYFRIFEFEHVFRELILQEDVMAYTKVFLTPYGYNDIFSIVIKTDCSEIWELKPLKSITDSVLIFWLQRFHEESELDYRKRAVSKAVELLFKEMEFYDSDIHSYAFASTFLGKLFDENSLEKVKQSLLKL